MSNNYFELWNNATNVLEQLGINEPKEIIEKWKIWIRDVILWSRTEICPEEFSENPEMVLVLQHVLNQFGMYIHYSSSLIYAGKPACYEVSYLK